MCRIAKVEAFARVTARVRKHERSHNHRNRHQTFRLAAACLRGHHRRNRRLATSRQQYSKWTSPTDPRIKRKRSAHSAPDLSRQDQLERCGIVRHDSDHVCDNRLFDYARRTPYNEVKVIARESNPNQLAASNGAIACESGRIQNCGVAGSNPDLKRFGFEQGE
jgi:hypothetical protein